MSKLYKNYMLLKLQNSEKIYLFRCGIFYIFIDTDAEIMSKILNLKLTDLNAFIKKCGFPINAEEKYFNILKRLDYDIEVIDTDNFVPRNLSSYVEEKNYETIVNDFLKLNIDTLSISQAFDYLHEFQSRFKEVQN